MANIVRAAAFSNNEVAFIAWELDENPLADCLGFHIVREHLDAEDNVVEERPIASYVAFKGQRNPEWLAQNTSIWPIQKFTWRDLTLRRRRDAAKLRPENERVRYRIRAVGKFREGLAPVEPLDESHFDRETHVTVHHTYSGKPIPLGYLTPAAYTDPLVVTTQRSPFTSTFTNGILSTQFLVKVLNQDGVVKSGELEAHLRKSGDWVREYLAGDVLTLIRNFFAQSNGRFYAALYELEDDELQELLAQNSERLSLILSDAGSESSEDENDEGKKSTLYDSRNSKARAALRKLADKPGTNFEMQDRMFNGSGHIGHNKFVVYVDENGEPQSVLTGSTNWTYSGVAGQSNNCIVINDSSAAAQFLDCWNRLHKDVQPTPVPLSNPVQGGGQGDELKEENSNPPLRIQIGSASMEIFFSPNMPGKNQPPGPKVKTPSAPPPDMAKLFSLMRKARKAIFFLVFMPSRGGRSSIVSEAVELGQKDPSLLVTGAISDTQAMWGYQPGTKGEDGNTPAYSPHVFSQGGVSVVRASALADRKLIKELGDFELAEKLTVGRAIIHDKILVIDPMDPENCVVAFGSHNLGYKASYSNDENLVIVRGHQALALAYTAHVLDVYDHYRFRAVELAKRLKEKNASTDSRQWNGFLATTDGWQEKSSHRLSRYFTNS